MRGAMFWPSLKRARGSLGEPSNSPVQRTGNLPRKSRPFWLNAGRWLVGRPIGPRKWNAPHCSVHRPEFRSPSGTRTCDILINNSPRPSTWSTRPWRFGITGAT